MREEPRYVVDYIAPVLEDSWQEEYEWIPPIVGHGIESPSGHRYRIVDVWIIHPKHGALEYGVHAFVEPVSAADDRLAHTYPHYYKRHPADDEQAAD